MDEAKKKIDEAKPGVALGRREWLVSLGSSVVLSCFRDALGRAGQESYAVGVPLPPGLYLPSMDHLSHALASEDRLLPIPPGTETDYVRRLVEIILGENKEDSSEKPALGAPASIYDEVAEWIGLVAASAPGIRTLARKLPADQRALAVAYFGSEEPVSNLETFEPERVCREGLAWLGEESQRRFGKGFLDADPAGQMELVQAISDVRSDKSAIHAGTRLFDFLKAECIRGFYTSRLGLKELDYKGNSFYGESPGCRLTPRSRPTAREPE